MYEQVLTPPSGDEWFDLLVQDVVKLQGTNNFVPIFNTGADHSKRSMLLFTEFQCSKRFKGIKQCPLKEFTQHWFDRIQKLVESLGLVQNPRQLMENTLLISDPGWRKQKIHFDFDVTQAQVLIKDARYEIIPLSVRHEYPYVICTQKWSRSTKMVITVNKNDDHGIFGLMGYWLQCIYHLPCLRN